MESRPLLTHERDSARSLHEAVIKITADKTIAQRIVLKAQGDQHGGFQITPRLLEGLIDSVENSSNPGAL